MRKKIALFVFIAIIIPVMAYAILPCGVVSDTSEALHAYAVQYGFVDPYVDLMKSQWQKFKNMLTYSTGIIDTLDYLYGSVKTGAPNSKIVFKKIKANTTSEMRSIVASQMQSAIDKVFINEATKSSVYSQNMSDALKSVSADTIGKMPKSSAIKTYGYFEITNRKLAQRELTHNAIELISKTTGGSL